MPTYATYKAKARPHARAMTSTSALNKLVTYTKETRCAQLELWYHEHTKSFENIYRLSIFINNKLYQVQHPDSFEAAFILLDQELENRNAALKNSTQQSHSPK